MKRLKNILALSMMCAALASSIAVPAYAEMHGSDTDRYEKPCKLEHSWKKTLTDTQRSQLERLHLALKKDMSVLRAELAVNKAELKELALRDNPDTRAIERKMDEISGIRKEMMKKRISHLIEVRKIFTPEQRVSFDSMIMSGPGEWEHGHRDWRGEWK